MNSPLRGPAGGAGTHTRPRHDVTEAPISAAPLPSGLVTFAMTDIEGSTRLFRDLGDTYVELLAIHRTLLRGPFTKHGGVEVGTEGDALFFAFADAAAAVAACLEGQRALATYPWPHGIEVRVRIGVHTSEATPVGQNYVDLAVHRVSRISAGGHGGQILLSEATAAAVEGRLPSDASLAPLGSFQLRGFQEPQRLFQLDHPDLRQNFPPLRLMGVVLHNLPFLRAGFVGRTEERKSLASLLLTEGVVTIVGLGGVGKTRLAVQVAFDVMDRFTDGAWIVELASLSDAASVPRAVAKATRVAEEPGRGIEAVLTEALADKALLLLLDNCEHLLDAVANLAADLSQRCPHLVIMATSREPLDIEGELVWRLGPLPVVDHHQVPAAEELEASDAVRLFVERARSVSPQFQLNDDNATAVASIVSQLNGIPLAIELAAAALGDRPLEGVVSGLADRFSLLSHGRRTAPPRHQTLRAALEWSLDLLQTDERRLFARLAAFASGVSTDAIAQICAGLPDVVDDIPRCLRHLARASLLIPHPELPERWSMLESVRQLAAIELHAIGEDGELATRHRTWFALRVERVAADIGRAGRSEVMSDLAADHDNVRRAIDTAISAGDGAVALRICTAMAPFWTSHGDWTEGCDRLGAAVDGAVNDPRLRGRAVVALGNLLLLRGDLAQAEARFSEGRRIGTEVNDDVVLARALAGEGYLAFRRSDLAAAQSIWERALEKAERGGDERVVAGILRSLAIAAGSRGRQDRARDLLDRAILSARRTADDQQLRLLLVSSAEMNLWLGDYQVAEHAYGDALALASSIGDLSARPLILSELGWVALLRGDVIIAERLSVEATELAEDLGNRRVWAHALRLKGEALMRKGEPDSSATALDRALVVAKELGAPAEVAGVHCSQACLALEEEHSDEARRLVGEAMALSALPHPMRRVSLRWVLGMAALMDGDLDLAEREFRTDLAASEEADIPRHKANSFCGLARVSASAGASGPAAELHQRALALRHRMGDRLGVVDSLLGLGMVAASVEPEEAARLIGAARALRARAGAMPTRREAAEVAAAVAAIAKAADPTVQGLAESVDEDLDVDSAIKLAARLVASTHDGVSDQARTAGRHWPAAKRKDQDGLARG